MKIKKRILEEMMVSEKDKQIKELVEMNIWDEKKIRLRWNILEKEKNLRFRNKK